jgi:iron complex outermembrane recepter protein
MQGKTSRLALAIALLSPATAFGQAPQPGVDTSDDIIVTGVRGALKEATEIERQSSTVVSVITADDAGQFADQNVAESLQRVPGITIQRVEGEGRTIQVRGLNSNFNQVVINGAQVGSSDPDGNRSVSLDIISSDLLSGIRVAKTLTPDTDHDSLGAQVNLLTLSAFDREGTTARVRAEGSLAEYSDRISPKVTADFTTRLAGDTLGIALAGTYSKRYIQSEEVRTTAFQRFVSATGAITPTTGSNVPNPAPAGTRFIVPGIVDQRLKRNARERIGGTAQIDFRPDDDNSWSLTLIGAQLKDADTRIQNEWEVGQTTTTAAATGAARYTTRLEQQLFFQDSTDRVIGGNFAGENKLGAAILRYGADYSKNTFTLPNALRGRFATGNTLDIDVAFNRADAVVSLRNPAVLTPTSLAFNQALIIDERRTDEIWSVFGDVEGKFEAGGNQISIKAGGKYRDRTKVIRRGERSANPTNGTNRPATTAAGIPQNAAGYELVRPANVGFPGYFLFPDPQAFRPQLTRTAEVLALAATDVRRDFDFREKTLAAFVQGQIDLGDSVMLIGGVRMEQTEYTASGITIEVIELNGTDLPAINSAPRSLTRKTTEWFPSLHLRADLSPTLVGRLSVSRGQVRPTFDDAKNFQEIETTRTGPATAPVTIARELDGGNPLLNPLIADQVDATLGWYPSRSTSLTAALFYKKLKNPFISATYRGAEVATVGLPVFNPATGTGFTQAEVVDNGGSGQLYGIELGINQFFRGALDGFFVSGNLTLIEGEARSRFVRNNEKLRLEDQARVIGNLSLGYEDERVTARISGTYVGDRLESVDSANAEFDQIRAPLLTVDVNLRFNATKNVQLYGDITNLTNELDYRYFRGIGGAGLVNRTSNYGRTFQLGAIVSF